MKQSQPPSDSAVPSLGPEARLRRRAGVVLRHVAGEHILVPTVTREVDLDSLLLLNAAGSFAWEQLDGIRTVADVGGAVAERFVIDLALATDDVVKFLSSLLERNLAERTEFDGH